MNKKYQIFISSTFRDLIDERQDAIRSVLDLGHIPSGMEIFPAADVEQFEYIKKVIDECDYYLLIIGGRYGSVHESGVSFTEKEYDYAIKTNKVVLAFLHGQLGSIAVDKSDTEPAIAKRLSDFRENVSTGRMVQFWTTREQLKSKVIISLTKAMSEFPATGWIRGSAAASEDTLEQLNTLRNANEQLTQELQVLRAATQPRLENLASMASEFSLRYKYRSSHGSTLKAVTSLTWNEILEAVGPSLVRPHTANILQTTLSHYIRENRSLDRYPDFFDSDLDTVKVQLMAHGLIRVYVANAIGGGANEWLQLTDFGTAKLLELKAIRGS